MFTNSLQIWLYVRLWLWLLIIGVALIITACEQYDPSSWRQQFQQERKHANKSIIALTSEGNIPAPKNETEQTVVANSIDVKYQSFCASCHGADGKADSEVSLAMNPKPRNLTDSTWQAQVDDEHILKVIRDGGTAVGLSSTMAPWGAVLSEAELQQMLEKVRSFAAQN